MKKKYVYDRKKKKRKTICNIDYMNFYILLFYVFNIVNIYESFDDGIF